MVHFPACDGPALGCYTGAVPKHYALIAAIYGTLGTYSSSIQNIRLLLNVCNYHYGGRIYVKWRLVLDGHSILRKYQG